MPEANDLQTQKWSDEVVRPGSEKGTEFFKFLMDTQSVKGDIITYLNDPNCAWFDSRGDGPPHLLSKADILAIDAGCASLLAIASGAGTLEHCANVAAAVGPMRRACVRF